MTTASLDLCKQLYELSGWEAPYEEQSWWIANPGYDPPVFNPTDRSDYTFSGNKEFCPAYDISYLLRKLPPFIYSTQYEQNAWLWMRKNNKDYNAWYTCMDVINYGEHVTSEHGFTEDTLENALCKLAIELFKQGILNNV